MKTHPAAHDDEAARIKAATDMVRNHGGQPKRVYRVELDGIAFVDIRGSARLAVLEHDKGMWRIVRIVDGWPDPREVSA